MNLKFAIEKFNFLKKLQLDFKYYKKNLLLDITSILILMMSSNLKKNLNTFKQKLDLRFLL